MTTPTTVTVIAGAYASIRAIEKAQRVHGPNVTVGGILNSLNDPSWVYEVRPRIAELGHKGRSWRGR